MSDPTSTTFGIDNSFWIVTFPIASLVIGITVAISIWVTDWNKDRKYQANLKKIINSNVKQLTKICNKLYADVDEIEGTGSQDIENAQKLSHYFDRNITRLEMLRTNIENQLTMLKGDEHYVTSIKTILELQDGIIEKCNRPDIPDRYKLSLWQDNKADLQKKTRDVIGIAKDLKIINNS